MFVCPCFGFQNSSIMISFSDVHDFFFFIRYTVLSYVWGCLMRKIQAFLLDFNCFTWKTSQPSPLHLKTSILCWGFQWLFTATTQQRAAECYVQGQSPIVDGDSEPGRLTQQRHPHCWRVEIFPYIYIYGTHTHTLGDFFLCFGRCWQGSIFLGYIDVVGILGGPTVDEVVGKNASETADLPGIPLQITSIQVGEDDQKKRGHLFLIYRGCIVHYIWFVYCWI